MKYRRSPLARRVLTFNYLDLRLWRRFRQIITLHFPLSILPFRVINVHWNTLSPLAFPLLWFLDFINSILFLALRRSPLLHLRLPHCLLGPLWTWPSSRLR